MSSIFSLHPDVIAEIGLYLDLDHLSRLRSVSKRGKAITDVILGKLWTNLMNNFPKGIVTIPRIEQQIDKNGVNAIPGFVELIGNFSRLRRQFTQFEVTTSGKFPITPSQFEDLQNQAQAAQDEALVITWPIIIGELKLAQLIEMQRVCLKLPLTSQQQLNPKRKELLSQEIKHIVKEIRDWLDIPSNTAFLSGLRSLNLAETYLQSLPNEIKLLIELESLNFSKNQIRKLPDEIRFLTKLKQLDCSDNQIKELPSAIGSLTQLEKFEFSGNPLKRISSKVLSSRCTAIVDLKKKLQYDSSKALGEDDNETMLDISNLYPGFRQAK